METRASHMVVGGFVLALLLGLVAFAIWLAKADLDAEYNDYDVYFAGSVFGLYKRSVVYYQGIPVGEVRDITLSEKDPSKVRVWLRLRSEVPVVEGSNAKLEFQGLTGVAFIELEGGPAGAPLIVAKTGEEFPVIPSEASNFQALFQNAPNMIDQAALAVIQVQKLLSDDNIARVSMTMANIEALTGNLARGTTDIGTLLTHADEALVQVTATAEKIATLADSGNDLLDGEAKALLSQANATMAEAEALFARVNDLVASNEDTVTQFLSSSLPEVTRMIMDLRATARNLSRLMSRLEQDPIGVVLDPGDPEYDLKSRRVEGNN